MTITEVLPLVKSLPHEDKLRLMQFLISALASDENINLELKTPPKQVKPVGTVFYSGCASNIGKK